MSKSSGSLNGKMKAQEDPNIKILRELVHIPCNKHCFDCGQRGPTYVNITIGSYVCMTCSGLLRGLTPPHRVKSISMASFTSDEIEQLKSKGNEYCRRVWLATCTPKDAHLGSEKDPDRVNVLRTFLSAKYEQKRFYVDPSKLSETELNEIQAQTSRALSSALTSASQNLGSSSSIMQKSPSLSSTRSSSSQHSNPSPVLNKIRVNNNSTNQQQQSQSNRLVNSITLPDIKSLTSLIGPSVPSTMTNQINMESGKNNSSINFINNLTQNQQQQPISKINNNNNNILNISPWGDSNGGDNFDNNSESNFADFEDAFSKSNLNGDFFAGQNQNQEFQNSNSNKFTNGNGISFPSSNISSGNTMQTPILPYNSGGVNHQIPNICTSQPNNTTATLNSGAPNNEDKYAALKDLDSLFKQTTNGDGTGENGTTGSLPTSASLPANLSTSVGSASTGWFSTSPQNPFFQAPPPVVQQPINGWNSGNPSNPHNPFAVGTPNSWKASPSPALHNNTTNSGIFTSGSSHFNFSPVSSSAISTNHPGKTINPFSSFTPSRNPNNPFL